METTEKDKCYSSETEERIWFSFSRRHFLSLAGWGLLFAAMGGYLVRFFWFKHGFFYPKVLFELSPRFAVGEPKSFAENSVTKLKSRWVFIDPISKKVLYEFIISELVNGIPSENVILLWISTVAI